MEVEEEQGGNFASGLRACIKKQYLLNLVVIPRLLKPEWFRQLYKTCDLIFDVPIGADCWPTNMFELLVIGIVFPFLRRCPWQLRGTPKMFYLARQVRRMFKEEEVDAGNFLRELLLGCWRLYTLQADVVRRMLFFRSDSEFLCQTPRKRGGRKRKRAQRSGKIGDGVGKQEESP